MNVASHAHAGDPASCPAWVHWLVFAPIVALAATRELWAPDEPRYAQIAREAYTSGNLLVMHLNGSLYPDKPPLVYWLAGAFGRLFQWSEFSLRVPSLCATLATAYLTARTARRFFGAVEASWAAACYLACVMVMEIGGRLQLDPLLSCLCLASLDRFFRAAEDERHELRHMLLGGLCLGLAALAKGPPAWLHVGLPLIAWRFLPGEARMSLARSPRAWIGFVCLSVAPVAGWAFAAATHEPALWKPLFYGQHIGRVAEGTQHAGPIWYHVTHLPYLVLPWTFVFASGLARAWSSLRGERAASSGSRTALDPGLVRAVAWFLVVLLFFSIIKPKRDLYLLPVYPAIALVCARAWVLALRERRLPSWIAWGTTAVLMLAGVVLSLALPLVGVAILERTDLADVLEGSDIAPLLPPIAWAGAPLIAGSLVAVLAWRRSHLALWAHAIMVGFASSGVLLAVLVVPLVNPTKSARSLAGYIASLPEKPRTIPCVGVQPEGYRFYSGVPTVKEELAPSLEREGAQFLGLITTKRFERLDASERAKYRIINAQTVGARSVLVLGAALEAAGS